MSRFALWFATSLIVSAWMGPVSAACATLDTDGDGICDTGDVCPSVANPLQGQPVKLNAGLVPAGDVTQFAVSADGQWAVYLADDLADERFELLAVPLAGGAVRRLNDTPVTNGDVLNFKLSPDSARAVYRADVVSDEHWNLYAADLDTGAVSVALDASGHGVWTWFAVSPAGDRAAYLTGDVYAVPLAGGSFAQAVPLAGEVVQGLDPWFTSDAAWFLFTTYDPDYTYLWKANPVTGDTQWIGQAFTAGIGLYGPQAISSDGTWVITLSVYNSSELKGVGLTPSGGGAFYGSSSTSFGTRFHGLTAAPVAGDYRVLSSVNGSLSSQRMHGGGLVSLGSASDAWLTADDTHAIYYSQSGGLFAIPILGGSPVQLTSTFVSGGFPKMVRSTPDGTRVVFLGDREVNERFELYSVPTGGGMVVKLTPPLVSGGDVSAFFVSPDGATVVYLADQEFDQRQELYAVPVAGGTPRKLNLQLTAGGWVKDDVVIDADGAHAFYRAEQDATGVIELYRVEVATDGDTDGVWDACDCAASDAGTWGRPSEVRSLRLSRPAGASGPTELSWSPPEASGSAAVFYDVLRTDAVTGFTAGSSAPIDCVGTNLTGLASSDSATPVGALFYLVRAGNACGEGEVGPGHEAAEAHACP